MTGPAPLLEVRDLRTYFPLRSGVLNRATGQVRAIEGVSLTVAPGQTYGVVGESGSGKTTLGRAILGLAPITTGEILLDGRRLPDRVERRPAALRTAIQPVFQDVSNSLNPRRTVGATVADPLVVHSVGSHRSRQLRTRELLELVELPRSFADRYPHELSGGERQRVALARALALEPRLIVLDEPTSALDVSVQAKIIELLVSVQRQLGLTYLLISHDLALVRNIADRIGVMYLGRVFEEAAVSQIFEDPRNPYTACLLTAVPGVDGASEVDKPGVRVLPGELPSMRKQIVGCAFRSRCPVRADICRTEEPPLRPVGTGHRSRCHFDTWSWQDAAPASTAAGQGRQP
jgi:peptide/nickel transport system ATP-binding protein